MERMWLVVIGILLLVIAVLSVKIYFLRKAAQEIVHGFLNSLTEDTNILIDLSSRDFYMRKLAAEINVQLRQLRRERQRYQQGDLELKEAVSNISHDLRTPLTAICGYLDLLEQEDQTEPAARYLGVIRNRTDMLRHLTDELFGYSIVLTSEQNVCPEPVIINRVLEESIAACYADLNGKGIKPVITMPDKKVVRTLDRSALSRVFSNLLNNAVKYSDGDLEIVLSETGELIFTNTASGLNEVQVGKLFDRFYTVEAARRSTGLGLSIARTLVLQMHGTITAEYENHRLCILLYFPEENVMSQ